MSWRARWWQSGRWWWWWWWWWWRRRAARWYGWWSQCRVVYPNRSVLPRRGEDTRCKALPKLWLWDTTRATIKLGDFTRDRFNSIDIISAFDIIGTNAQRFVSNLDADRYQRRHQSLGQWKTRKQGSLNREIEIEAESPIARKRFEQNGEIDRIEDETRPLVISHCSPDYNSSDHQFPSPFLLKPYRANNISR